MTKRKKQRQRDTKKQQVKSSEDTEDTEEIQEGEGLNLGLVSKLPPGILNFELVEVCKHLPNWKGVFSRDALPSSPKKNRMWNFKFRFE